MAHSEVLVAFDLRVIGKVDDGNVACLFVSYLDQISTTPQYDPGYLRLLACLELLTTCIQQAGQQNQANRTLQHY
jgi:hypothetical protein